MKWNELSMADRARYIRMGVASGLTNLNDIHSVYDSYIGTNTSSTEVNSYKDGGVKDKPWNKPFSAYNTYSAGVMTDELYKGGRTERLEKPNYDHKQSDKWADAHGYYPDERGHRDDRVKKSSHPTHPSKGTFVGEEFRFSDKGMKDPNFTIFGLVDNKDGYAIPTYNGTIVLPELTVTPKRNYVHNSYDNINIVFDDRSRRYNDGGTINLGEVVVTPRMSYINYTGNETNPPSIEEYKQAKREEVRANAILNIQNTIVPTIPTIPNKLGRIVKRITGPTYSDDELIFMFGKDKNPSTCIATATNAYNRVIPGNITFKNKAEELGFKRTNKRDHGDIVQISDSGNPFHAGVITGFNREGNMIISQSHGGLTASDIEHNVETWDNNFAPEDLTYWRFVGNKYDNRKWEKEYKKKYKK